MKNDVFSRLKTLDKDYLISAKEDGSTTIEVSDFLIKYNPANDVFEMELRYDAENYRKKTASLFGGGTNKTLEEAASSAESMYKELYPHIIRNQKP